MRRRPRCAWVAAYRGWPVKWPAEAVDLPFREGKPSRSRPPGSLVASVHRSLSFSTSFALVGKRSSPLLSSSRTATSPAAMIGDELIVLTEACERVVEIGRASCWERVCQYVLISVVAVTLK